MPPVLGRGGRVLPAKLPLGFGDGKIVDTREPALHETIGGEFPVLVPVSAKPLPSCIMKFIFEPHGDAVAAKAPKFFAQAIVEFARPFAPEQFDDGRTPIAELGAVAPFRVLRIGQRNALGVATVPAVLGELDFEERRFLGEWRKRGACIHRID